MEDLLAPARRTLDVVRNLCRQTNIKFADLVDGPVGVGICLAWGDSDYSVISVMAGGNENQVMVSSGVLRDVMAPVSTVLQVCNQATRDNTAYPTYLHDAPAGNDVLIQRTELIAWLIESPAMFNSVVRTVALAAQHRRDELRAKEIDGYPYRYIQSDLDRLLLRSLL